MPGRRIRSLLLVALATAAAPAQGQPAVDAEAHLLAGVRAFRAERHAEALREFELVARARGGADIALYLGPTLYKLGRFEEARAVLSRAHRGAERDAVTDYYLGLTYYRLGLTRLAGTIFAGLDAVRAGPKLAAGAARFLAEIEALPEPTALDDRLATAERAAAPDVALDHATEVWLRATPGTPARTRAAAVLVRVAERAGATLVVLDLLHGDVTLPPELRLALARLAVAAGASARARPLLDDVRRRGNPAARAAAEELARGRP